MAIPERHAHKAGSYKQTQLIIMAISKTTPPTSHLDEPAEAYGRIPVCRGGMLMQEDGKGRDGSGNGGTITPTQVAMTPTELHQLGALGELAEKAVLWIAIWRERERERGRTDLPSLVNCVIERRSLSE